MKSHLVVSLLLIALVTLTEAAVRDKRASPAKTCGEHEEYLPCGPSCQTECPTLNKPCLIRHIRCPDGCYCKENFARQTIGGRCIPKSQCGRN